MIWLALAAAGGLGAVCRFVVDARVARATAPPDGTPGTAPIPLGTAVVNASACLLMGLLVSIQGSLSAAPADAALTEVLGVGLLGGYSTFSTAAVEGARLLASSRWGSAALHGALMTLATLLAAVAGLMLGSTLTPH
ncbi:fluoride efflux transporter FluC [Actinomyces bowdenii]|uniref:Fluoride-specific ion channel FluC n=1 Tax=Actinomyces bowdenii TaxID=131109 RepID=A0A853EH79_9ACTO|nr:CrcB family protein [Actinomyces bowdenii]MBF0696515.1 CrcB family protein [Actinomyces bowdenii]NYS68688.1 CrcB family protein [Actinomyces bowdenii]